MLKHKKLPINGSFFTFGSTQCPKGGADHTRKIAIRTRMPITDRVDHFIKVVKPL